MLRDGHRGRGFEEAFIGFHIFDAVGESMFASDEVLVVAGGVYSLVPVHL